MARLTPSQQASARLRRLQPRPGQEHRPPPPSEATVAAADRELEEARAAYAVLRARLIAQERSPQRAELVAQFRAAAERLRRAIYRPATVRQNLALHRRFHPAEHP